MEVKRVLSDLIAGNLSRRECSNWAERFILSDAVDFKNPAVWDAIISLSGADMITVDRPYLYDEEDFRAWLGELERRTAEE